MYQDIFDNAVSARESLQAGKLDRVRPRKRTKRHIRGGGFDSTVSIGTLRLCDIRGTLESGFEMQRSKTQARMHESFLNACARFLYSDDTNAPDFTDILEDNQWDDLRQQVLCMTPRRVRMLCGKIMRGHAMLMWCPLFLPVWKDHGRGHVRVGHGVECAL